MRTTTAAPATATATSSPLRRHRALAAALAIAGAAALAACGGSSGEEVSGPAAPSNQAAFTWVRPQPAPHGWRTRKLPSGAATLAYPPGWRLTRTDPGTVT